MTSPSKPWEDEMKFQNTPMLQNADPAGSGSTLRGVPRPAAIAPPLPPRNRSVYPNHGMGMSRYSYGGLGGFGGMGYGGYGGYGYSPFSMQRQMDFENRYVQMAEESAAPAFESIDGFIRGFSSVTMMLESTFQAMHMSFRAILAVGENMSRMKSAVIEFLSALAILKSIYFFYRKILYYLGLVNGADVSWSEAEAVVRGAEKANKSYWPMLAFLAAIFGGPFLVRLLSKPMPQEEEVEIVGIYDFESDQPNELSFKKGDRMLAKKSALRKQWVMVKRGSAKGYVPYNRIGLVTRKYVVKREADSTKVPKVPPVVNVPTENN